MRSKEWGLRPLACWDCGFELRRGHGCLSVVSVVCCQVELSASGWSLVQRSSTDCGVSERDNNSSIMRRHWPIRGCCTVVKNIGCVQIIGGFCKTIFSQILNRNTWCCYHLKEECLQFHSDLKCIRCAPPVWPDRCPGDTPIPTKPSQACLVCRSQLLCRCTLCNSGSLWKWWDVNSVLDAPQEETTQCQVWWPGWPRAAISLQHWFMIFSARWQ